MRNRSLLFILLISLYNISNAQKIITLEECIKKSIENYPLIKSYELIEQTKSFSLANVKKNNYPKFSTALIGGIITGLPSINNENELKTQFVGLAQIDQMIWDGGISKNKRKIIVAEYELKKAQIDSQIYALELKVIDIYFGLLLIKQKIDALNSYMFQITTQKKRISLGVENGLLAASDLTEIEIAELEIQKKDINLQSIKKSYTTILSLYINQDLKNITPIVPENTFFEKTNSFNRHEYKAFEAQNKVLDAKEGLQKSSIIPKFGIKGIALGFSPELGIGQASTEAIVLGGLSFSWNIDGLYKNKTNKAIIELSREQIKVDKKQLDFNLSISEQMEREEFYKFQSQIEILRKSIALHQKLYKSYQSRYDQGVITVADLIQKLEDIKTAKINLSTQEISCYKAVFNYNHITGK